MRFSAPLLLAVLLAPSTAMADDAGVFNVILENDAFASTDHHYTSGIMFSYAGGRNASSPEFQHFLRQFPGISEKDAIYTGLHLGQQIFTPENIHSKNLLSDQRPYAGYLFAGISLLASEEYEMDSWKLSIGRVGPSARAEEFQSSIHSRLGVNVAQGWEHQLADETILQFDYHKSWREVLELPGRGLAADFMPFAGFALGNAAVHADAGISLRIGRNLGSDLGPPRMHPSLPSSSIFNAGGGWYFFVGIGGRYVARNIFLDGNTHLPSHRVEKVNWVGDIQSGWVLNTRNYRLAYTFVARSREFENQPEADGFGSLTLSFRF